MAFTTFIGWISFKLWPFIYLHGRNNRFRSNTSTRSKYLNVWNGNYFDLRNSKIGKVKEKNCQTGKKNCVSILSVIKFWNSTNYSHTFQKLNWISYEQSGICHFTFGQNLLEAILSAFEAKRLNLWGKSYTYSLMNVWWRKRDHISTYEKNSAGKNSFISNTF